MPIEIHVHPSAGIAFKPLDELVPLLGLKMHVPPANGNGGAPVEVPTYGLVFTDPDGDIHVWVFTDEGRHSLLENLTGGIAIASPSDLPRAARGG